MSSVTFKVGDMSCSNCVDMVRSSVGAIKGVENVKIDSDSKSVSVDYDDKMVNEQQIKNAVTEMGYTVQ